VLHHVKHVQVLQLMIVQHVLRDIIIIMVHVKFVLQIVKNAKVQVVVIHAQISNFIIIIDILYKTDYVVNAQILNAKHANLMIHLNVKHASILSNLLLFYHI